jgi:cation transport ATPase
MVLFTGLWTNSGLFGLDSSAQDEDDEGDHAPTLRTTNLNRTDGKNDTTILNHGFFQPPTDYGSTKDDTSMEEPSTNSHENNKAITWDAALFAPLDTNNAQNNNKNNLQDETASTSTTATLSDLELPSLSGAFQALENRPILIHCAYYLAIYFAVAIVAYSYVFERWTIIDSMYFAVATLYVPSYH